MQSNESAIYCMECGELMFITADGISHHGEPDEINFDADAAHTAFAEEDNTLTE